MEPKGKWACPMFAAELDPCGICGNHIFSGKIIDYHDGKVSQMCEKCGELYKQNMCQFCDKGDYCAFQQDASCQIPPVITQQFRQGNAVVQTQVKNPERVKATCEKGCKCYNEELKVCMRECGGCSSVQIKYLVN
jgi:hypothetical protein